ncbi:MAG TPA: hypothetical protein VGP46_14360 [Acidimicrobiales bacterium]|nr:hypothetical protein [Acidimicrobiales bacterium]
MRTRQRDGSNRSTLGNVGPPSRRLSGSLGFASVLAVVDAFAFRIELIIIGFVNPLTQHPSGNQRRYVQPCDHVLPTRRALLPTRAEHGIVLDPVALLAAIVTEGYHRSAGPHALQRRQASASSREAAEAPQSMTAITGEA